jgi:thioredoxin reductase (NADPH)
MAGELYDVIVIGSGPAGYTASIYAVRANLKTLLIAGLEAGGQLMLTSMVENYPGFPEGILGPELMERMREQAERQGVEIIYENATAVNFREYPLRVYVGEREFSAKAVIVATGASPQMLGLESEKRLMGLGVSTCAVCDGPLFKDADRVIVVGGGDTAMEYAIFMSNLVREVLIVHRRDKFRASPVMQQRALSKANVKVLWNSVVTEILGQRRVEGVRVKNLADGSELEIPCRAIFIAIGHRPNTEIFRGQLELDERGYIRLRDGMRTSVEGVYAAGDVHDHRYRQAVTAAGFGCMAALEAISFVESGRPEQLMAQLLRRA